MSDGVVVHTEQQELKESENLSWAYVLKAFFKHLDKEGKQGQKRNFKTAFKQFLEAIGVKEDSLVGMELTEEFEAKLKIFVEFEVSRKLRKDTYEPRVSKIRALKMFVNLHFASKLVLQNMPKAFGQRLVKLIYALGLTIKGFWRRLPEGLVPYKSLIYWCAEKYLPSAGFMHVIPTIESCLHVPPGTLRLSKYHLLGHDLKIGISDVSIKSQAAISKPYYVWTESVDADFQGLSSHKTIAMLPEGEERSDGGLWTSGDEMEDKQGGDTEVPSASLTRASLESFLGFCALPITNPDPYLRGAGIPLEALSIALVADKRLVESFLDFKKLRSGLRMRRLEENEPLGDLPTHMISADCRSVYYDKGGKYNNGSLTFLSLVSSLLRPNTGYLYQHPEFALKLGTRMTATDWHQQCKETRIRVDQLHRDISRMKKQKDVKHFDFGRDPKELIQWILDLPRPLEVLHQMVKDMLDDLLPESAPKMDRARQYRNIVLAALLSSNPLRIRMFSIMKFDKNLYRDVEGTWWLKFNKSAFKNRKSLKSDYEVRVAPELWALLDRYRDEFHPILAGSTRLTYVFIGVAKGQRHELGGKRLSIASLSNIIRAVTELYIPDAIGFRPHAFRHIFATDIIKVDPRFGVILAGRALHDKQETVEAEYIHLRTSEYFEPVNTHFSEMWRKVFGVPQADTNG